MLKLTIPIQIDSIKNWENFERTRCIYYRVELDDGYVLRQMRYMLGTQAFFAAGISWAALAGPLAKKNGENDLFLTPEAIDETIKSLHANEQLSLDLGYIWVPNHMFQPTSPDEPIREGDIYRMSQSYFRFCYRFSLGKIPDEEWLDPRKNFRDPINPSPQETIAFRNWRQAQIETSRRRYHQKEYASLRLAKKVEER